MTQGNQTWESFSVVIVAVNNNTTPGFQAQDLPEAISYDIESLDRFPPITRQGVTPTNVRPSPNGIAQILSARVGDIGKGAVLGDKLKWWVPEALYVKACPNEMP